MSILSSLDREPYVQAALLLKPTGSLLASWARNLPVRAEDEDLRNVVTVMAATLLRSIDALVESLGGVCPLASTIEANDHLILATRIDGHRILLLVARKEAGRDHLWRVSRQLVRAFVRETPESVSKRARWAVRA